jgi:hypothetical protein
MPPLRHQSKGREQGRVIGVTCGKITGVQGTRTIVGEYGGFGPGPAVGVNGHYWYRSTVEYERPVKDMTQTFYAKTYRSTRNPQPFRIWAGCI